MLCQTSSVTNLNRVSGLTDENLLNLFLSGLRDDIRAEVDPHDPKTLTSAFNWAKMYEKKLRLAFFLPGKAPHHSPVSFMPKQSPPSIPFTLKPKLPSSNPPNASTLQRCMLVVPRAYATITMSNLN